MVQQRSERFVRVDGGWMQLWVCKWCMTRHLTSKLRIQQEITWLKRRHVAASSFFGEVREHYISQPAENAQCFHGTGCTAICLGDAWDAASWWAWGLSLQGVLRFHEVSFRVKANPVVKGKKGASPGKMMNENLHKVQWGRGVLKPKKKFQVPQATKVLSWTASHRRHMASWFQDFSQVWSKSKIIVGGPWRQETCETTGFTSLVLWCYWLAGICCWRERAGTKRPRWRPTHINKRSTWDSYLRGPLIHSAQGPMASQHPCIITHHPAISLVPTRLDRSRSFWLLRCLIGLPWLLEINGSWNGRVCWRVVVGIRIAGLPKQPGIV